MTELVWDEAALVRVGAGDIARLTEAATRATFYRADLTPEQIDSNRRVVEISAPICIAAAASAHQRFGAALVDSVFAGYVVTTVHAEDDRELDWLMVHPDYHGTGIAVALMTAGIEQLGADRPMWLNVIAYNERAIRFYRRFGFEIDASAEIKRAVPHLIMRRAPAPLRQNRAARS